MQLLSMIKFMIKFKLKQNNQCYLKKIKNSQNKTTIKKDIKFKNKGSTFFL